MKWFKYNNTQFLFFIELKNNVEQNNAIWIVTSIMYNNYISYNHKRLDAGEKSAGLHN